MIIDNIKKLIVGMGIVGLLLLLCVAVDYADDEITNKEIGVSKVEVHNNVSVIGVNESDSNIVVRSNDKIHTVQQKTRKVEQKPKIPTVTMTGKPSCSRCARNGCSYTWRTRTYINYCPHCHHYGCLGNKHKFGSRYEQEISCFVCDSDFCVNCGKTKYSWSNVYLRKA